VLAVSKCTKYFKPPVVKMEITLTLSKELVMTKEKAIRVTG